MIFTLDDVTAQISPKALKSGWTLFNDNRVVAPNVQRGGELITAIIPKAGKPLRVYIRTHLQKAAPRIEGECSCARGKNCEHVAAVLLKALEGQQAPSDPANVVAVEATPKKASKQAIVYVIQLNRSGLLVETYAAQRLNNGHYSTTRYYDPDRFNTRTPARFFEPADQELLPQLNRLARDFDAGLPQLDGPQSAQLLDKMLDTGRCFFLQADESEPFQLGPVFTPDYHWQIDDFGFHGLKWDNDDFILLPLSSPRYLHSKKGVCGPVLSTLPDELLLDLARLPPIPPEDVNKAFQMLGERWPDAQLPAPPAFKVENESKCKPVPCLTLTSVENIYSQWDSETSGVARLSFDYNGVEVTRHSPTTKRLGDRIIRVIRDRSAERKADRELRQLGLEEIGGSPFGDYDDNFEPETFIDDVDAWMEFQIEALPVLRSQGWQIRYGNFPWRLYNPDQWHCDIQTLENRDWFQIGLGVGIDGLKIDLVPLLLNFLEQFPRGLPRREEITTEFFITPFYDENGEERLLQLPAARILPLLETVIELAENHDSGRLQCSRTQLARFTALDKPEANQAYRWQADNHDTAQLLQQLRRIDGIAEVAPPEGLTATLRPYQRQGLDWLQFLRQYSLAGILADDMGLGKTLQALAHVLVEKEAGRAERPSLVVAPTSLMFNWRQEAQRFAPRLKILVLHGPQRKKKFAAIQRHDLVITTYPLLTRDRQTLLKHDYHLLILDEAQVIKNPKAQAARTAREINARHRLCLTGTPLENHLGELWALFDLLLPGLLGNSKQFRKHFRTPIEKQGNEETGERLSKRIRPFLLRRTKQQVVTELPEKNEIIQAVVLEDNQRELYETTRVAMQRRVREEIERHGLARCHITVLDALLKLRQVCCDPRLVKMDAAQKVRHSAKLETLMTLLPEMIEEGRRILLFSQFTTMLGLIEDELRTRGIDYVKLTGKSKDRETPVQRFQAGGVPVFLISLKAGGVGLNLTRADTVIHYDPWWNPAVERQATDRAHRIGQQQTVFVYKLICEGTLEEKIHAMQQRKQALAESLYQGGNQAPQWSEEDLDALFAPLG